MRIIIISKIGTQTIIEIIIIIFFPIIREIITVKLILLIIVINIRIMEIKFLPLTIKIIFYLILNTLKTDKISIINKKIERINKETKKIFLLIQVPPKAQNLLDLIDIIKNENIYYNMRKN